SLHVLLISWSEDLRNRCFRSNTSGQLRVVQVQSWTLRTDARNRVEVVTWWRARGCPLQRSAEAPWIVNFNLLAVTVGNPHVPEEWNHRCTQDECEHGRNLVHGGEPVFWHVVSVTTWHTHDAQPVLGQEGAVAADEQQPEVDLAKALVEHLAGPLWPPEVEASEHCEYHGAEDYVVEVSNHEVGIRNVEVHDRSRQ